jgi:hypothetical protein
MDAYDISEKIKKYWMDLVPKNSGEISKSHHEIKVIVLTSEGYREVTGVRIDNNKIQLVLDEE